MQNLRAAIKESKESGFYERFDREFDAFLEKIQSKRRNGKV
ncbi:MAG: hypothetical protein II937_17740 [Bacteroidales bacterium]|nr:hypothetical protein [Bacteroidales bacterium]